jgi:hypothetical protein
MPPVELNIELSSKTPPWLHLNRPTGLLTGVLSLIVIF